MYVDNLVTGADSTADALQMYADSKRMFDSASMNLREWLSSSAEFNKCIPENDRRKSADTTVLGHGWNNETDVLYVHTLSISDSQKGITKRSVLKVIASVYDPQGLFSAVLVKGKLLLQEIWKKKYGWDDVIGDDDIRKRWFVIKDDIAHLSKSAVQRCIGIEDNDEMVKYNLLCFCDASRSAYAATVYLHQFSKNKSRNDLVFSKTRLAPVKEISVPRLELMAVVIGVECLKFVERQYKLSIEKLYMWTDSSCVIG